MSDSAVQVAPAWQHEVQLSTLSYWNGPTGSRCRGCEADCGKKYYLINGNATLCPQCKKRYVIAKLGLPIVAFIRSWLFGTAAGLFGAGISCVVLLLTGQLYVMLASLVGFLVGKAVCIGSRGRGGWIYETMAVAISYTSIVIPYIIAMLAPLYLAPQTESEALQAGVESAVVVETLGTDDDPGIVADHSKTGAFFRLPPRLANHPVVAVLIAWALACAVPFLGLPLNWGTWIFIGISLVAAWRLNMHPRCVISIQGPLSVQA